MTVQPDPVPAGPVQAGPSRPAALAVLALGVLLAVLAAATEVEGALLCAPASAVAVVLGLRDLLLVPVLRADGAGLQVVAGLRRHALGWDEVTSLRVVTDRRAVLLEVELADDDVLLVSRHRLGRDPRDVLEELEQLRGSSGAG